MSLGVESIPRQPSVPPSRIWSTHLSPCAGSQVCRGQQCRPHRLSDEPIWPGLEASLACSVADREPAAEPVGTKQRARDRGGDRGRVCCKPEPLLHTA